MTQHTLWSEPQVVRRTPTAKEREALEALVEASAKYPLLFGEQEALHYGKGAAEDKRKQRMRDYIRRRWSAIEFLIACENNVIGYAAIWDGWVATESEYGSPVVECAFVDRGYRKDAAWVERDILRIRNQLYQQLESIEEEQE